MNAQSVRELGVLNRIADGVTTVALWMRMIAGAVVIVLVVVTGLDVVMRYIFRQPLEWSLTVCMLGLIVAVLFAAPHITATQSHIAMDLFYRRFSPRSRRVSDIVSGIAAGFFALLVGVVAAQAAASFLSYGLRTSGSFNVPVWIGYAVVGAGFLMVALVTALSPWRRGDGGNDA